jgi:peptidoglycan-N-acetylglucosamine deacetylase
MKLCAVSVDLDEIPHYHRIHGLSEPASAHPVYDVAFERLEEWARSERLPLTWFAIGADLTRPANARALSSAVRRGDEIGNHSQNHLYDLTRRELGEQSREVSQGSEAIQSAVGEKPRGFRAPGYTVSDALLATLQDQGYAYDSSVFPCPAYYAAKAAKLLSYRVRGRRSAAVLDTPAVLGAPTRPYRVGRPYWKQGDGLAELPIQVTPGARLPFIGTTLALAGADGARLLCRALLGEPLVNLELHGLDGLGQHDGLTTLERHQPDLRISVQRKLEAFSAVIGLLRRSGYSFVRLDEAASLAVRA